MKLETLVPVRLLTGLACLTVALAGCAGGPRQTPNAVKGLLNVSLDGDTREWPVDSAVAADEHFAYFRMTVENEQFTLQSSPESMVLLLDVDASVATGKTSSLSPLDALGIDLEVRFSPQEANGKRRGGVVIRSFDAAGNSEIVPHSDIDFLFAPTSASSWYEARLSRTPMTTQSLPFSGLRSEGALSGLWALEDEQGAIVGYSDPFTIRLSPAAEARKLFTADLPVKPENALRVMTLNVENSGPAKKPEIFGRLIQAIDPDVLLLQEWDEGDDAAVQSWFTAMAPTQAEWFVHKAEGTVATGGAVIVVSKYPIESTIEDLVCTFRNDKNEAVQRPVRFAAAMIDTPLGKMMAGSAHLKCCGTKDSREDRQRMEEARAIAEAVKKLAAANPGMMSVIGGDLNLVGSRPPLDILRAGCDGDGTDLAVAEAFVLGDLSMYTWSDGGDSGFSPGRLDYVVYSDCHLKAANTFVLDTSRLSEESLARLGLDATDSEVTDHRPVVVDLKRR